jgi:hypothetical protein
MRLIAIVLSMLVPAQAMALSCVRPTVERSFAQAQASDDYYAVVRGRLTFDESKIPKTQLNSNDAPGSSLSQAGFKTPFDRKITIELRCFGPWCGSAVSGSEYLGFMKNTASGYALSIDPCQSQVFPEPTPQMLDAVTDCLNGAACSPKY